MTLKLGFAPSEDPFVVQEGGFYRRWLRMLDDHAELHSVVTSLKGTTQDLWVPAWRAVGRRHEDEGDRLEQNGDLDDARREYLIAKTYYAIGRFPGEVSAVKRSISEDCARAYRKACAHLDPPMQVVEVAHSGKTIRSHFRAPREASPSRPVPAVLIMCGADVFKEDRGWAQDYCLDEGMAALVMDAPGTGENPFPWAPESVSAWVSAINWLGARPEIRADSIGAFGISRGGYSVMQLAGTIPDKVGAVVASAGHPFGYVMPDDELEQFVAVRNDRATWRFGGPDDPPSFPSTSMEQERAGFSRWALSELGLVDRITQPVLMINGKHDHLAPIGNIYYMLENGPPTGRQARVYPDDGHCAFKHFREWAPASFAWLAGHLTRSA
jgi:hypothetical protein